MDENKFDIIEEYFKTKKNCHKLDCQKVIFEPQTKKEWFFEDDEWCCFEFLCEFDEYKLLTTEQKDFDKDCYIKNMSYEIKMLLNYYILRGTKTIEKELLSNYINKYEKLKEIDNTITLEKFNLITKIKEDKELEKAEKLANKILSYFLIILFVIILGFGIFLLTIFFAPKAEAKSKYTPQFIQHFYLCQTFSESQYNIAYNAQSTYEILGYAKDGSEKCIYRETNTWLRGSNITTCRFSEKQKNEYHKAMLTPDIKGSVLVKGMPVVGKNEDVVYLKFFNNPKVCKTVAKRNIK